MWSDALATADRVSGYFWSASHIIGAIVMAYGWRKYRQRFFMWMTLTWAIQTLGGATRELFAADIQTLIRVGLRIFVTAFSFTAFYYGVTLVRRKSHLTVIGIESDGNLRVREGMEDHVLEVKPLASYDYDRSTIRPPPPG